MNKYQPIGVFDSGFGGLTILKEIQTSMPEYDYIYMGDNARAPYGPRDFDTVYQFTWQAVQWFFQQGCELVILACNTASAKALRTIQQQNLPNGFESKRVLGVIRPTAEIIGDYTQSKHVGILGTNGTVQSESYLLEIQKFFPEILVSQQACPEWVEIVENNTIESEYAQNAVQKHIKAILKKDAKIDALLLACTHYPLLINSIGKYVDKDVRIISQGALIAKSLKNYLNRHPEMEEKCSKSQKLSFFTTGDPINFDQHATQFFGKAVKSSKIKLG